MTLYIAPIVEGHTEQQDCIERLLQRVWGELLHAPNRLQVLEPFRCKRDSFLQTDGRVLTETVTKAALKLGVVSRKEAQAQSLLLILLDAEDDCPATLSKLILERVKSVVPAEVAMSCVLPKRMTENWIVAGCATLAGVNGLPDPLPPHSQPEDCGGAGWLDKQLRLVNPKRKYSKTIDAKRFINAMSLDGCRANSRSFRKLCKELELRLPPPQPLDPPSATEPRSD